MPHIRAATAIAFARLTAMKLYAYRALDYLQAAGADDRRYLLFNAVQKARVSTEGVKVMGCSSECIGARGFEADTYFEIGPAGRAAHPQPGGQHAHQLRPDGPVHRRLLRHLRRRRGAVLGGPEPGDRRREPVLDGEPGPERQDGPVRAFPDRLPASAVGPQRPRVRRSR